VKIRARRAPPERMLDSGEPGSLVGTGTCDAARRPHPTTDQPATAKQHRSPLAASACATPRRRASIGPRRPRGRSPAIASDRRSHGGHPSVADMRDHPRRLRHHPTRRTPLDYGPIAISPPTLAALTVPLLILNQRISDRAIDLIAERQETRPIVTVHCHRQRLLARRRRKTPPRPWKPCSGRPQTLQGS